MHSEVTYVYGCSISILGRGVQKRYHIPRSEHQLDTISEEEARCGQPLDTTSEEARSGKPLDTTSEEAARSSQPLDFT